MAGLLEMAEPGRSVMESEIPSWLTPIMVVPAAMAAPAVPAAPAGLVALSS